MSAVPGLLHHFLRFLLTCACDNSCYCSNFFPLFVDATFLYIYWGCALSPSISFSPSLTQCCTAAVCVFLYSIFECRWRDDILALLLPYLTCLVMHILNFVQSTHTMYEWMNFPPFSNRARGSLFYLSRDVSNKLFEKGDFFCLNEK